MTVIITKAFEKDFLQIFRKEELLGFVGKISKTPLLNLDRPYKKYKFYLKNLSIRGICIITQDGAIIPIYLVKKSDKLYGENLISQGESLKVIENKYRKSLENLESGNYIIF